MQAETEIYYFTSKSVALWPFLLQTKQLPVNEDFLDPEYLFWVKLP